MIDPLISALPDAALIDAYNGMEAVRSGTPNDEIGSAFNQAEKYAVLILSELSRRGTSVSFNGLQIAAA